MLLDLLGFSVEIFNERANVVLLVVSNVLLAYGMGATAHAFRNVRIH